MSAPAFVVCFDRDEAVSTNPHPDPDKPAVPLSWVKYLAHGPPDVDVWATGNQTLCKEASIPGTERALATWRANGGTRDGRFSVPDLERFELPRRDRLHVIADLYASAEAVPTFVVVDDADLTNMTRHGWQHAYPWEFVRQIDDGTSPLSVPDDHGFSDDPLPDDHPTASHYDPSI